MAEIPSGFSIFSSEEVFNYIIITNKGNKMNNITIIPEIGFPFVLVTESKWGYKWIKWITQIELSDNEFILPSDIFDLVFFNARCLKQMFCFSCAIEVQ